MQMRVPLLTIVNTHPDFYWVTNYIETQLSAELWKPITSATIAYEYRRLFARYAAQTGADPAMLPWMGHDFSARGMSGIADGATTGAGHLLSFYGTDTIAAIDYLEDFYPDAAPGLIGGSVPGHRTFRDVHGRRGRRDRHLPPPDHRTVSVRYRQHRQRHLGFLARADRVRGRAEAGDPGPQAGRAGQRQGRVPPRQRRPRRDHRRRPGRRARQPPAQGRGRVPVGHLRRDHHRTGLPDAEPAGGADLRRQHHAGPCQPHPRGTGAKGYSSGNMVFGIGSFTYQHVTRDSFGTAIKATFGVVDGEDRVLFKAPKTDNGIKNSARGLLRVEQEDGSSCCTRCRRGTRSRAACWPRCSRTASWSAKKAYPPSERG